MSFRVESWGLQKIEIWGLTDYFERLVNILAVRRNFFSDMRYINDAKKKLKLTESGEQTFDGLVEFVESCSFTKSKHSKFLCENWKLDVDALSELWTRRTGQAKAPSTFRDAISNTGAVLYSMFPSFSRELFVTEIIDDDVTKGLANIDLVVEMLSNTDCTPVELFEPSVRSYVSPSVEVKEFEVEECRDVIKAIKPLLTQEVYRYLDGLDFDKLAFILSVLSEPLVRSKERTVNLTKLKVMKELGLAKGGVLPSVDPAEPVIKTKKVYVEVPEKIPYKMSITKSLSDLLEKREKSPITPEEVEAWDKKSEASKESAIKMMLKIFTVMTEDGFEKWLAKQYPLVLSEVLDGRAPIEGAPDISFRKEE